MWNSSVLRAPHTACVHAERVLISGHFGQQLGHISWVKSFSLLESTYKLQ